MAVHVRKIPGHFFLLIFLGLICSVSSKYQLKDLEFNFKESDPPPKIFTKKEIAKYDGSVPKKPIYLAVKGVVFDVTSAKRFYGRKAEYNVLAGKDATRAIAKMSVEPEDLTHDINGLSPDTLEFLDDVFEGTYMRKYRIMGYMDYLVDKYPDKLKPKTEL